jgi:hypothetical protein
MTSKTEHAELLGHLRGDFGRDLLAATPLVSAHIESTPVLEILRTSAASLKLETAIGRPLCLVAFGSLGRREYVTGLSDLDPLIIVEGKVSSQIATACRTAVLTPLAAMNPWLPFDHGTHVVNGHWDEIANVAVPYPVVGTDELLATDASDLTRERQWQVLLEGRPIFNNPMFHQVFDALLPQMHKPHGNDVDFQYLASSAGTFFGGFDNPLYLYKSPFKYFKTRFLRDFFVFGSQLTFLLGYYLQQHGEWLHVKYIRAATVNKMMRAVRFAQELDRACAQNKQLTKKFTAKIIQILEAHDLDQAPLLQFGATEYKTDPGRLLHGLLMSVLSRFSACWEQIYDPYVRSLLADIPRDINLDSPFAQKLANGKAAAVAAELQERRDSYRAYMSATAAVMREVFAHGRTWAKATVPSWIEEALTPFIRIPAA